MAVELHYQIDAGSGVPAYRQMMDQVRYYVASGVLKPGDQLDSIRELAQKLAVNPTTVVKAYNELAHEGVIDLQRGRGAFVAKQSPTLSRRDRERALRRLAQQLAVEARQMGFENSAVLRTVEEELDKVAPPQSGADAVALRVVK